MNKLLKVLGVGLLAASGVGYAYWHYQDGQAVQWAQLQALDDTLANLNAQAQRANDDAMRRMQATVENNRNQARELQLLNAARQVQTRTRGLLTTLRTQREQLLRQTGNQNAADLLRHPTAEVTLAPADAQAPALATQLQAYAQYIKTLYSTDSIRQSASAPLPAPWPLADIQSKQPVGLTLATLTQLEADLLACEAGALQHLSRPLGARRIPRKLMAVATAETNVVAPGATYKAQLYLVNHLYGPGISMSCNGQPVPVGPDGLGEVRFRAPAQPGAASWLGTVRVRYQGRDSTFQVRVPYHIARP